MPSPRPAALTERQQTPEKQQHADEDQPRKEEGHHHGDEKQPRKEEEERHQDEGMPGLVLQPDQDKNCCSCFASLVL